MDNEINLSITLPGYEAQLSDNGESHSRCKVQLSAKELSLASDLDRSKIFTIPSIEEETLSYRSSCTFQILKSESDRKLHYAMRQNKKAVVIGADYFPVATQRIQDVMKLVMKSFNRNSISGDDIKNMEDGKEDERIPSSSFESLKVNLSSASFVSSWNHDMDCIVTLNYDKPIFESESELQLSMSQAEALCLKCNITTLILRSKKKKIMAGWKDHSTPFLRDTIQIAIPHSFDFDSSVDVTLGCGMIEKKVGLSKLISVYYEKPQDAFQHPNHNAMLHALRWMLTKLKNIAFEYRHSSDSLEGASLNLLEMYCGCGAHTMAIAKMGLFNSIVTVEIDNRLVDACRKNAKLNGCIVDDDTDSKKLEIDTSIHIFQGDAGEWSRKILKQRNAKKISVFNKDYNVLLVDPPRAGLDSQVCELAKTGSYQHIIYISCGREALKGDVLNLSDTFEVVDCTIIDLFPRTDSVESLVHLKRRTER